MSMQFSGSRHQFALGFELLEDPDESTWLLRKSWGRLQIWVAGHNLTLGHTRDGEPVDAAEVPLLPVVEWLADVWDPLLHEERLPRKSKALSAASWRVEALARLPSSAADLDSLLEERDDYWRRHGLGSALSAFRVPDLHLRRRGDEIELSWDDREWRSIPTGVTLAERPGYALAPLLTVAEVLLGFADSLLAALAECSGAPSEAVTRIDLLRRRFASHRSADRHAERLRWMAGVDLEGGARRLLALVGLDRGSVKDTVRTLLGLDSAREPAPVTHATVPALLFRSVNPRLSTDDLTRLLELAREDRGPLSDGLAMLRTRAPVPRSATAITSDGLERALDIRTVLGVPEDAPLSGDHDLESIILPRLGVNLRELHLDDVGVDGVAVATPGLAPTIAVNLSSPRARTRWGRRMTLAHELCHILFDVDSEGQVGVVSNAWADMARERRANAFAVMLLAPEPAIEKVLSRAEVEKWTRADLEAAMAHLGIGTTTLTWQLQNLGWIDATTQEYWVDTFAARG